MIRQEEDPYCRAAFPWHKPDLWDEELLAFYQKATGLDPRKEHPDWNIAHRTLLGADIPTIEQVGGDVDVLAGKRATFLATPWKFEYGDACPVRFIGMIDPAGKCRIDAGNK